MFMKMNSKQMKHLTVRPETVKLLEGNIGKEKALAIGLGIGLGYDTKSADNKTKDKCDCVK